MLLLIVFSETSGEKLANEVMYWINNQGAMIEIKDQQFSTNAVSSPYDNNCQQTEYHAAIWYREL